MISFKSICCFFVFFVVFLFQNCDKSQSSHSYCSEKIRSGFIADFCSAFKFVFMIISIFLID